MLPEGRLPWSGHMGLHAAPQVMARIRAAGTTIVFVNTRAQAELVFQELWRLNDDTLPIALHHGSLAVEQRRKVEAAMAEGKLRAVVATSSLDLGIDWGGVDQVIQVGAPKGVCRLLQRVGRANHRLDEPSRAILVPANRFEVLECQAALLRRRGAASWTASRRGRAGSTCWRSTSWAWPAPRRSCPTMLYAEVTARRALCRAGAARISTTCCASSRPAAMRWRPTSAGASCSATPRGACTCARRASHAQHRMNIGTIVEAPMLKVRLVGKSGSARCWARSRNISSTCSAPGDTFMFAGRLLRFLRHPRDGGGSAPRAATASRRCRPMRAAGCR